MNRIALVFLCLLIALPVSAQQKKQTDREADELKGPVMSVRVETEHLNENGKPNEDGRWLSRITSYDLNGNKTEDETFYAFGKISYGKYVYSYDANGRKGARTKYQGGYVSKEVFTYDEQLPALSSDASWINQMKYDAEGRLAEIRSRRRDDPVGSRQVYKYEDGGQVVRQESYDSNGNPSGVLIKTYNDQGQLTSYANGDDANTPYYNKEIYTYGEIGYPSKMERYDNKGLWEVDTYSYELDTNGSWVKRTATYERRDQAKYNEITYRTITYYNALGGNPPGESLSIGSGRGSGIGASGPAFSPEAWRTLVKPVPLNRPVPVYTEEAKIHGIEGNILLRVLVTETGAIKQAKVVKELPYGLNEKAVEAAFKLKFKPATVEGKPIAYWVTVEIVFKL